MKIQNRNILVTGGAGMIGSHLVEALLDRGCEISVIDNFSSGYPQNIAEYPNARLFNLDIADDEGLDEVFENGYDVVFHLAANFANRNSVDHPERDLLTNGLGILKILDRCRRFDVSRFAYASSSCVYGNSVGAMDEATTEFDPGTPYAMTKLLGEQYTRFYSDYHGLSTVILRYFNCYGPREFPGKYRNVIPNFLYRALCGQPLKITGNGEETRDFCYVTDLVIGTILAAEYQGESAEIFNISGGRPTRILELAEKINDLTGNRGGIAIEGRRTWDHVVHRQPSTCKAEDDLGYSPKTSLDVGLKNTLAWMITQMDDIPAQMDHA